jgi:hypothetical protein
MSTLTDGQVLRSVVVPISVPETEIPANSVMLVSQFQLAAGQVLYLPWLNLHWVGFRSPGDLSKANSAKPLVYAALYANLDNSAIGAPASSLFSLGGEIPGVYMSKSPGATKVTSPGTYSILLVNNSACSSVGVLLTGGALLLQ